jgi:hypothetical protein
VDAIAKVRKAISALIMALGGALILATGIQTPGGAGLTAAECWTAIGMGLAAAGAVFLTPNRLTSSQRAQAIADYQAARFRSSGRHTGM